MKNTASQEMKKTSLVTACEPLRPGRLPRMVWFLQQGFFSMLSRFEARVLAQEASSGRPPLASTQEPFAR